MRSEVSVTGCGLRVPGAADAGELWGLLLRAGCAGRIETFAGLPFREQVAVARAGPGVTPGVAPGVGPPAGKASAGRAGAAPPDRPGELGLASVADAVAAHPRFEAVPATRRAVVVGTGFGPLGTVIDNAHQVAAEGLATVGPRTVPRLMSNGMAAQISMRHDCRGPAHTLFTACASGTDALGYAWTLLRADLADLVIVCGVDAPLRADILAGFQRLGALSSETSDPAHACRPFDLDRTGFMMGEGACTLVLETGLHPGRLGTIQGYAASSDAHHVVAPRADGAGAAEALGSALRTAGLSPAELAHVNAHGTGTTLNDRTECVAISAVLGADTPVWSLKGSLGHLMGAAGTTEALASLLSLREQHVPATAGLTTPDPELARVDLVHGAGRSRSHGHAVSSSFAFGGHNACVVLGP